MTKAGKYDFAIYSKFTLLTNVLFLTYSKYMNIQNNLRQCRKLKGYTLTKVSDLLKMDCVDRLSKWENGRAYPSVTNLFRLCVLYQVLPHEIYPILLLSDQDKHPQQYQLTVQEAGSLHR